MYITHVLAVNRFCNSCIPYTYVELLASRIFGDLLQKYSWRDFYLAILSTVRKETHAYSLNDVHLI